MIHSKIDAFCGTYHLVHQKPNQCISVYVSGGFSSERSILIPSSCSPKHQGLSKGRPLRRGSSVESWIHLCLSWTHHDYHVCLWSSTTSGFGTWAIDLFRDFPCNPFFEDVLNTFFLSAEGLGSGDLSCVGAGSGIQVIQWHLLWLFTNIGPYSRGWKCIGEEITMTIVRNHAYVYLCNFKYLSPWGKLILKKLNLETVDWGFEREIAMPSLRPEVFGSSFGTACARLCRSCTGEDQDGFMRLFMTDHVRYTVEWCRMIHTGYIITQIYIYIHIFSYV